MAGACRSASSATSFNRSPAYPCTLSTCAAASRIRARVWADLESPAAPWPEGEMESEELLSVRLPIGRCYRVDDARGSSCACVAAVFAAHSSSILHTFNTQVPLVPSRLLGV